MIGAPPPAAALGRGKGGDKSKGKGKDKGRGDQHKGKKGGGRGGPYGKGRGHGAVIGAAIGATFPKGGKSFELMPLVSSSEPYMQLQTGLRFYRDIVEGFGWHHLLLAVLFGVVATLVVIRLVHYARRMRSALWVRAHPVRAYLARLLFDIAWYLDRECVPKIRILPSGWQEGSRGVEAQPLAAPAPQATAPPPPPPEPEVVEVRTGLPELWVSPGGERFHGLRGCPGLRSARVVKHYTPCLHNGCCDV